MSALVVPLAVLALIALALAAWTALHSRRIERRYPALGPIVRAGDHTLHVLERGDGSDGLPPLLFLHGASGNLRDQLAAFGDALPPTRRALFVDRPGHGHSERGPNGSTPSGQADALAALLDARGIERTVVVGHSFGGAVALGMALEHPDRVAGLVLLSPASHTWPGGRTSWYYALAARPILGRLFAWTLLVPFGLRRVACAVAGVFSPQPVPENYPDEAATLLAIRPGAFRANALDVTRLYAWFDEHLERYRSIRVPTIVVAGTEDAIVPTRIHAERLAPMVPGARLVSVPGLGHKPDFTVTSLVLDAIEAVDRNRVGAFFPSVPEVPRLRDVPSADEIEPGIETGPEAPASAR